MTKKYLSQKKSLAQLVDPKSYQELQYILTWPHKCKLPRGMTSCEHNIYTKTGYNIRYRHRLFRIIGFSELFLYSNCTSRKKRIECSSYKDMLRNLDLFINAPEFTLAAKGCSRLEFKMWMFSRILRQRKVLGG